MSGQKRWSGDEDGIAHLDDSILLAYIRQQTLGKSLLAVHQHIAHCAECQERTNELRQTSIMLEDTLYHNSSLALKEDAVWDWLQSPEEAQLAYQRRQHERLHQDLTLGIALLTRLPSVLRALSAQAVPALLPNARKLESEPQRRGPRRMTIIPLSGAFAATFLALALTAIVVLATHNPFQPSHLLGGITTTGPQPTMHVPAHMTATSVVGPQSGSGATLTPGVPQPTIFECMTNDDKAAYRFRICGNNFKPETRIELVMQFGDGSVKTRHLGKVDPSGEFQDVWSISSCKDVPITIAVQNMTRSSVDLAELQNISYEKCSSNLLQKAGTNHP